ncbi:MAG: Ig-like domain-containing protein [Prevotellaceae bacterium]|nr:Ig-like domain-containing protein [Prevotellaceae bacterium]
MLTPKEVRFFLHFIVAAIVHMQAQAADIKIRFGQKEAVVAVEQLTLSCANNTLAVGDALTLTPTLLPASATNQTVTWSSSDTTIATVSNGKITARAAGTATITATNKAVAWTASNAAVNTFIIRKNGAIIPSEVILYTADTAIVLSCDNDYILATIEGSDRTATCTVTVTLLPVATPAPEGSMALGSLMWASVNVDDPGKFAARPDMYTKFYQWNQPDKAWPATGAIDETWRTATTHSYINATTWTNGSPCPPGWRLPTRGEYEALDAQGGDLPGNKGGRWAAASSPSTCGTNKDQPCGNAVAGRFYGKNFATCSLPDNMVGCVFFPASGYRNNTTGALNNQGALGYGWSSTQYSAPNGYNLRFLSTESNPALVANKANGLPVRCVQ